MSKEIIFVTSNKGKVAAAQSCFKDSNVIFSTYDYDLIEPRTEDITEIAKCKVEQAYNIVKKPCIALDAGFYIPHLNDFPKTFVNFALQTINISGFLKLMENVENRNCYFKECLAYYDGNKEKIIKYFYSTSPGILSNEILGNDTDKKWSDLWYIFIPEGYTKTLAQFTDEEREKRKQNKEPNAIKKFATWFENNN